MTKHGGRYYLQYGAPGTEFNVYANGTYVADKPLGPFKYADYNPIAYKPGGFVQGAGHGSTFEDAYGNWWNTGTPWIGYNWTFERRIDMFPAKFEADGQLLVLVALRRFPAIRADARRSTTPTACSPAGCCCPTASRRRASSTMGEFAADRVTDENPRTFWVAAANRPGETLTVDLGAAEHGARGAGQFRRLQVGPLRRRAGHLHRVRAARLARRPDTGSRWRAPSRRAATGPTPISSCRSRCARASSATCTAMSARRTSRSATCACSAMPTGRRRQLRAGAGGMRHSDQRDATIRWAKVPGAVGYNIRFGIRPDRLTQTYQLWADELGRWRDARKRTCAR